MISQLQALGEKALNQVRSATALGQLDDIRVSVLGKKGALSEILKGLKDLPVSERPQVGQAANTWKVRLEEELALRKEALELQQLEATLASEKIDVTLPSRKKHSGSLHVLTQTTRRIITAFGKLGFDVTTGPEVETDFLNFEAVNIPQDHPARDMQDTFFIEPGVVLRTHTTPVQMRTMLKKKWPIRVLCPGTVYRCDNDATHSPMFHQIEGLWVDRQIRMSDLKGCLDFFAKEIFGPETQIRLRPSYFSFVEPGAEMDVSCPFCRKSSGECRVCKGTGWVEILGAGMVHPHLFGVAGYDTREVSGFAFGMGIERISMLLHQIPDLRLMFQADTRFLSQF